MEGARIFKIEVKIILRDGNEAFYSCVVPLTVELEEMLLQVGFSIEGTYQGSLVIVLRAETSDTVTKLRTFIENGNMSLFLAQLFKTAKVQKLFMNREQKIEIQIKKVEGMS